MNLQDVKKLLKENLFDFNGVYKPSNKNPKNDGFYMTIRCGLGGIYFDINEWKNDEWQTKILDASKVIAYSRNPLSEELVNEYYKDLYIKYEKLT